MGKIAGRFMFVRPFFTVPGGEHGNRFVVLSSRATTEPPNAPVYLAPGPSNSVPPSLYFVRDSDPQSHNRRPTIATFNHEITSSHPHHELPHAPHRAARQLGRWRSSCYLNPLLNSLLNSLFNDRSPSHSDTKLDRNPRDPRDAQVSADVPRRDHDMPASMCLHPCRPLRGYTHANKGPLQEI